MTIDDMIEEAERLSCAATPGPWRDEWDLIADRSETEQTAIARDGEGAYGVVVGMGWYDGPHLVLRKADAAFIAAARTLLPALASALRRAERVVEAAEFMTDYATDINECAVCNGTADHHAPELVRCEDECPGRGLRDALKALRAHDHPDATGETGRE